MTRTPSRTRTRTTRSSEHAAHRLLRQVSYIALVAQGLALCVIPCHPCMRTCVLFFERLSSPVFLLPCPVLLPALPDVQLGA